MPTWLQHFVQILLGGPGASTGEVVLRSALIGCSLFASVQLLTMVATRWGDHHAMAKSFVLSVLVHLCIGLGWATVVDANRLPTDPPGEPSPIPIRQVLVESPEELSQPDPGNTPVWQQPLDVPDLQMARVERDLSVEMAAAPQRTEIEREAPLPLDLPQLSTTSADPTPAPAVEPTELESAPTPAQAMAAESVAEARTETGPVTTLPERQAVTRAADADPLAMADPRPGAAQRTAPELDELAAAIPLPLDQNPALPRPVGPETDTIARRASPAALPIDNMQAGSPTDEPRPFTPNSPAAAARFTRSNPAQREPMPMAEVARVEPFAPRMDPNRERLTAARRPVGPAVDDAALPELIRQRPSDTPVGTRPQAAATTYRLRRLERRKDIALRNGGSELSEQAVEAALEYLARVQEPDGYWDADRHGGGLKEVRQIDPGKPSGGTEADTGVTGLALLAFLGAGYTHEEGDYAPNVSRAIEWLIAQQRSDGYLGGRATYYDQMYCHGIAVYALAEAFGMQSDPTRYPALREAVARGVWYITETQNTDGGWRYRMGASLSDMSMFGWQLMALKSADLAGIATPAETRRGMIQFLRDRSRGTAGGLAGYKQDSPPTPAMTAEALFCKQMYGLRRTSPASQEAVRYLESNLPQVTQLDEYYWYYGTLALFQYGGEPWDQWNGAMRDTLVRLQRPNGDLKGSWDPAGPWGSVGGRIYSTALSVMCLEVYYRFLPLYQVGGME